MTTVKEQIDEAEVKIKKAIELVEEALKDMGPSMCIIVLADNKRLPAVGHAMTGRGLPSSKWVPLTVMIGAAQTMLIKMVEIGKSIMGDECLRQVMEVTEAEPIHRTIHIDSDNN